jgi:high-affinity Fe2+/Pb2+ permease
MNADDMLMNILTGLVSGLPVYLVWLVGVIYALVTWRKHPGISVLAIAALLMQLLVSLVFIALTRTVPQIVQKESDLTSAQMSMMFSAFALGQSCLSAVAYLLLLLAVFKGRKPPPAG